jgi:superfamily II DNA helicase RecQ
MHCNENCDGYTSLYWKKKEPKILQSTFSLFNNRGELCEILCTSLGDAIKKHDSFKPVTNSDMMDHKRSVMNEAITRQQQIFDEYDNNKKVKVIEINQNPDLWISHTGWHKYLNGYVASDITDITKPFAEGDEEFNLRLERNLEMELNNCVAFVKSMNSLHQLFFEVERRPNMPYPNKRFCVPSSDTMKRYIRMIRMIFRVVIRTHDHQQHNIADDDDDDDAKTVTKKHPKIPFSRSQSNAIQEIKKSPIIGRNYIDLLLLMIEQSYLQHPYECTLICALAFTSLNHDGTFKIPSSFTGTYAALIGICKVLVIHRSMTNSTSSTSSIQLVQTYTKKYLAHPKDELSHPNVMSYIINIFSYALAVSRNTPADGFITWDGHTLIFQNIRISMLDFRSAILQNISDAEKLLMELCEVSSIKALPIIPWSSTYDNFNSHDYDYSFFTEPKNNYVATSKLFNDRRNIDLWINNDGTFNFKHITKFKRIVKSFLQVLLCLVHVTSGQPARGTEIVIYQHTNSSSSSNGSRNIFIDRGLVCIFSHYHKNITKANRTKDIFRFLPERVGNLMVYYLWLVLPYYQKVVGSFERKMYRSTFLWTDGIVDNNENSKVWNSGCLTNCLQKFFSTKIGCDMNTNKYRHIAIAIVRKFLDTQISIKEDSTNIDNDENESNHNNIWDLQAAHTTNTSLNVYARKIGDHHHSNESSVDRFRHISLIWHDFIFPTQTYHCEANVDQLSNILREQRLRRFYRLKSISPEVLLKNFINTNASFRGNQEPVITAILNGTPNILQIAGTGVGKSLSFMLPASSTTNFGTSIIIVPLKALQHDLEIRCSKHGIIAKIWNENDCYNDENIFFVTPESASKPKFLDFINWLKMRHQLDHIFIDECHLLLSNSVDFRKHMDNLKIALRLANVQLIMLTATLPKKKEAELFERLDINDHVKIFRDTTVRKNIRYQVTEAHRHNFVSVLKDIISKIDDGRCIIYARTLKLGEQLSGELMLDHYHSRADNKFEKFNNWAASKCNPTILATSALGCGLDIPDIKYVIHVGSPGSLCDFAQESGRAGRDGRKSISILINIDSMKFKIEDDDMTTYITTSKCRRIVLDSVLDGVNKRTECGEDEEFCDVCEAQKQLNFCNEITKDLDITFFDDDDEYSTMQQDITIVQEEQRHKKMRIENIERATASHTIVSLIEQFREAKCLVCELCNLTHCPNQKDHIAFRNEARKRSMNFIGAFRRTKYKIAKYIVCFQCLCPQDICTKKFGDKSDCVNQFVMLDVIYLICIINNAMNHSKLNDLNYMLEVIRNFGHYDKTIHMVKIFHDMATSILIKK